MTLIRDVPDSFEDSLSPFYRTQQHNGGGGMDDDTAGGVHVQGLKSFSTLLFSGCLGCGGRLPLLGGRPRDIQLVAQEASQQEQGTRSNSSGYFAAHV